MDGWVWYEHFSCENMEKMLAVRAIRLGQGQTIQKEDLERARFQVSNVCITGIKIFALLNSSTQTLNVFGERKDGELYAVWLKLPEGETYGIITKKDAEEVNFKIRVYEATKPLRFITRPLSSVIQWAGYGGNWVLES